MPSKKWILVIDDDHAVRHTLSRYLKSLGFEVACGGNGQSALEALESKSDEGVAAIFVDGQMPVMDGDRFLHELRSIRPTLLAKTVWISGGGSSDLEGLAATYVPKPLWPQKVKQAL